MDSDDLPDDMLSNDYLTFKADTSTDEVFIDYASRLVNASEYSFGVIVDVTERPVTMVGPDGEVPMVRVQPDTDLRDLIKEIPILKGLAQDQLKLAVTDEAGRFQGLIQPEWIYGVVKRLYEEDSYFGNALATAIGWSANNASASLLATWRDALSRGTLPSDPSEPPPLLVVQCLNCRFCNAVPQDDLIEGYIKCANPKWPEHNLAFNRDNLAGRCEPNSKG